MTDTDLTRKEIDKKKSALKSYRENSSKLYGDLQDVQNNDNLTQGEVRRKTRLLRNNISICDYQIRIIENKLMIDRLRKDNLEIKTGGYSKIFKDNITV